MARTLAIAFEEVEPGTVTRSLLNTTTAGSAVIAKILVANGLAINAFTGADSGTGDVTLGLGSILPSGVTIGGTTTLPYTINSITAPLQIQATSGNSNGLTFAEFSADTNPATVTFIKSRGTSLGSMVATASGDYVGNIEFWPVNANATTPAPVLAARIRAAVVGTPGTSFAGGRLEFWTGLNTAAPVLAGMFDSNGQFVLGNNPFAQALNVNSLNAAFQQLGLNPSQAGISQQQFSADALGPVHQFHKSRATTIGSAAVGLNSGDVIGKTSYVGVDASNGTGVIEAAYAQVVVDGTPSTTNVPSRFEWYTGTLAAAPALGMVLNNSGQLLISSTTTANSYNSLTPSFQVKGVNTSDATGSYQQFSADALGPSIQFMKSRNSIMDSLTVVQNQDVLGKISWVAVNNNGTPAAVESAYIQGVADGSPGTSFAPGRIEFYTGSNSASPQIWMGLTSTGQLVISSNTKTQTFGGLTPSLQLKSTNTSRSSMVLQQYSSDAVSASLQFYKSRAVVVDTMTALSSGDVMGKIDFYGTTASGGNTPSAAYFQAVVDGSPSGTSIVPGRFEWYTGTTTVAPALSMALTGPGQLLVATNAVANTFNSLTGNVQVKGISNSAATIAVQEFTADALGGTLQFVKSRNAAIDSYTAVVSGDVIGKLDFIGVASTTTNRTSLAYMQGVADGSPGATQIPGRLEFYTGTNAAAPTLRMKIDSSGTLTMNGGAITTTNTITGSSGIFTNGNVAGSNYEVFNFSSVQVGSIQGSGTNMGIGRQGPSAFSILLNGNTSGATHWATVFGECGAPADQQATVAGNAFNPWTWWMGAAAFQNSSAGVVNYAAASGNASGVGMASLVIARSNASSMGATNTALSSGDIIGALSWNGSNGNATFGEGARITAVTSAAWSGTSQPTQLNFYTTAASSTTPALNMVLDTTGGLELPSIGAGTPTTADTGFGRLNVRTVGGRKMFGQVDETGQHTVFQPHWGRNNVMMWDVVMTGGTLSAALTGIGIGVGFMATSGTATQTFNTPASTNYKSRLQYISVKSPAATASVGVSIRTTSAGTGTDVAPFFLGAGSAAGGGGFHIVYRFGVSDTLTTPTTFLGLRATSAANPSGTANWNTLTNVIGLTSLSTDATQWYIAYGGSTAQTAIALGTALGAPTLTTGVWEFSLFAPENSNNTVYYQLIRLDTTGITPATGTLTGTAGTVLPANSQALNPIAFRGNSTASIVASLDLMCAYFETDT